MCNCDLMLLRDCYGAYMVLVDMLCVGDDDALIFAFYGCCSVTCKCVCDDL